MFVLRNVTKHDLKSLMRLASMLNTLNLPHKRSALEELIEKSESSFHAKIRNPKNREYLFVMEDLKEERLVGTSMIIAQHGTRESPHLFFEVLEDQRYSSTLGKHFCHQVMRLGKNFDGPTEIGGLVLDPKYRGHSQKLGKQLSYVRFLLIAMKLKWFRKRLLAELLPPLLADGRSLLWESLGRPFTGLDYMDADFLSRTNKEFITSLFPSVDIYLSMLSKKVRAVIGQAGPQTMGVQKMLEDIGFHYTRRIDPFDGGPHFEADTESIWPVQALQWRKARIVKESELLTDERLIAIYQPEERNAFRSALTMCGLGKDSTIDIPQSVAKALKIQNQQKVALIPISRLTADEEA